MSIFNAVIAQEICNNGKDDDGDGLIDLFDPECQCHFNVTDNLLENGSFESYNHCPVYYTYDQDYKIATDWQFGTYFNIGEANFYHNLKCPFDSLSIATTSLPHLPMPNGTGFISIYNSSFIDPKPEDQMPKTYVGQCLQTPLKKDSSYTLSFYAGRFKSWDNLNGKIFPFNVAVFGNANCNAVPFGKVNAYGNGCPANYLGWVLLGETTLYSSGKWVQGKITFNIPFDINLIEIGPDCSVLPPVNDLADSTTFLDYHIYYLDDLHLLPTQNFHLKYIQPTATNNCNELPVLFAPSATSASYQWYKDSIAIIGATSSAYKVTDTSDKHYYNVMVTTPDSCFTSESYLVTPTHLATIKIPADTFLCPGKTLLLAPPIEGVSYVVDGVVKTSVTVTASGLYSIIVNYASGCKSMFTTKVELQNCTDCEMYIPNAFTPNGDGLNDVFRPKINCFLSKFHCRIYSRWGKIIFESNDINETWNGYLNGIKLPSGSYVYYIDYATSSGITKTAKGVVVLIQ